MFKVECPGCKAPYQVDERRIPPSGLKMRCPKCGTSFKVDPPTDAQRTGPSPVLGAVFGMGADSIPPPVVAPPAAAGPPRASALKRTMAGVAPQAAQFDRGKGAFALEARGSNPHAANLELDLPSPAPDAGLPVTAPPRTPAAAPRPAAPAAPRPPLPPARAATAARPTAPAPRPPPPTPLDPAAASPGAPAAPGRRESSDLDLDLPLPVQAKRPAVDLPSPAAPRAQAPSRIAQPARPPAAVAPPAPQRPPADSLELDLPSIAQAGEPPPPPRHSTRAFGDIELDLPSTATSKPRGTAPTPNADLPSPRGPLASRSPVDIGLDLPDLADPGVHLPELAEPRPGSSPGMDLPDLGAGLPEPTRAPGGRRGISSVSDASLPALSSASLPSAANASGFPSPATDAGFPAALGGQPSKRPDASARLLGDIDLGGPGPSDTFGELDLPLITPAEQPSRSDSGRFGSAMGADPLEVDPFGEAPLPPPRASLGAVRASDPAGTGAAPFDPASAAVVRQQGGGTSYGEVNLSPGGESDMEMPLDAVPAAPAGRADDDMEFGGVPQETEAKPVRPKAGTRVSAAVRSKPAGRKVAVRVAGVLVVLGIGGASLALVPSLGPFGAYWILDRVNAGEHQKLVLDTVGRARRLAQSDSWRDAKASLATVESARDRAKRVRALAAYASFAGFARELRFGPDPEAHARAGVALDALQGDDDTRYVGLARAAQAATDGQLARARQLVDKALSRDARDVDALAVKGEVELRAKDAKAALAAFESLAKVEDSARARFGIARARFAADDHAGAEREARKTLEKNADHVGARVLIARIAAASRETEPRALERLSEIIKNPSAASPEEQVSAHTLIGDIHLSRSRISNAERAYEEALKIDPKAARALVGLGESLYRAGRYSEAQARFEAGSQADPDDVLAKVGVAKSKLMLERLEEAHTSLKKLYESHKDSTSAAYWYGRVLEAIGNRDEAEKIYRDAIAKAGKEPVVVDAFIALALLQDQQGRADAAKKTLQAARERLPRSAAIHRAVGEVALSHGRYDEAQAELKKALDLDPEDLGARFRLGSALRRDGKFDEALQIFEQVRAADKDYPGLALENGLLFEASGRTDEALKSYEQARTMAPDDPDLTLRVGCAYAAADRAKEAQPLLKKVLALRPTSAETNYCLGRALLAEGSRLAEAVRLFDRAVELDPHKAEYHLYVGWAANEAGNVPKAEKALDQAIKLDQGLADAYWQRGILRARQGSVREAITDLTRALSLRPSRYEVHAALADAYYDSGRETLALAEWKQAVSAKPDNATWRFRYGKLLAANQMNEAARAELAAALELADKTPEGERWIWEAHHFMARALGNRPEAARHWEQFLKLGPLDSPYRSEAKAALQKLGKPWNAD